MNGEPVTREWALEQALYYVGRAEDAIAGVGGTVGAEGFAQIAQAWIPSPPAPPRRGSIPKGGGGL